MRNAVSMILVLVLAACSGGRAGGPGQDGGGVESETPAAGAPEATSQFARTSEAEYEAGAATATVDIDGHEREFTGGTCTKYASTIHVFELVAGDFDKAPYLDIYVGSISSPVVDGEYSSGLNLVTMLFDDEEVVAITHDGRVIAGEVTVTFRDGVTAGEFTGTNANPALPVSGSFTC